MSDQVIFNLGFVFEGGDKNLLETYSQKLAQSVGSLYVLGVNSLPHVTLLQFEGERSKAQEYWNSLGVLKDAQADLDFQGVYADPKPDGGYSFGLRMDSHEVLFNLQKACESALSGLNVINKRGYGYFPHATLSLFKGEIPAECIKKHPAHNLTSKGLKLGLGISGPEYQFEERLF